MKNLIHILLISGLSLTMVSCGAVNDGYGNNTGTNYPNNNGTVYRAGDGAVYGRNEVYRDRNGNVYQNGSVIRQGDVYGQPGILGRNANQTVYYPNNNQRRLPPGQAKKIYGGNAKDYAPGQIRKRNNDRYYNESDYRNRGKNDDDRGFRDQDTKGKKPLKQKNFKGKRDRDDD